MEEIRYLTGKERRRLRAKASLSHAHFQLGKKGPTPQFIEQVNDRLKSKGWVKIHVLKSAGDVEENAKILSRELSAEIVQIIGRYVVLYRPCEVRWEGEWKGEK